MLIANKVAFSMDWRDNVFVEFICTSYEGVGVALASIGRYLDFYNRRRPHSSLDRHTTNEAYFDSTPVLVRPESSVAGCWMRLRSGYGGKATYRSRKTVQTNRASSIQRLFVRKWEKSYYTKRALTALSRER